MSKNSYYKVQSTEQEVKSIYGSFAVTTGSMVAAPGGVPTVSGKGVRGVNSPQPGVFIISCSNPPGGSGQNATYVGLLSYDFRLVQSGTSNTGGGWVCRDLLAASGSVIASHFSSGSTQAAAPASGSVFVFRLDVDASKFYAF